MNTTHSDEITFLDLIRIITQYKHVAIAVFILVLIGGVVMAVISNPIYRAEVILAPADNTSSAGGSAATLLSRFGGLGGLGGITGRLAQRDQVSQGMATLQSQQFTRDFIDEKQLLPVLFAGKWDADTEEWVVDDPKDVPTLSDGYMFFNKVRIVEQDDKTGLITVAVEWTDPELAAEWANDLVWRLNESLRADAITEANETIEFLNSEVEKTRIVQLQQAIYFMLEEQINIRTMANIRQEFAFKVISPAIAPEEDRYIRPNRLLIVALSIVLGTFLGLLMSCIVYGVKVVREDLQQA